MLLQHHAYLVTGGQIGRARTGTFAEPIHSFGVSNDKRRPKPMNPTTVPAPEPAVGPAEVPPVMRFGAVVLLLQCAAIFVYCVTLVASQFGSPAGDLESASAATGYVNIGTAVFLVIIFGFLSWVGVETLRGRPRATGAILLIEAIFFGVSIYMFRGGAVGLGIATLCSAILALIGILHPQTRAFNEALYEERKARRV